MNRKEEMTEIKQLIGMWLNEISLENAETYYGINKVSEHLCRQLMNLIYGYQLVDLNKIKANFPGLDIGDDAVAKIALPSVSKNFCSGSCTTTSCKVAAAPGHTFILIRSNQFNKGTSSPDWAELTRRFHGMQSTCLGI